MRVPALALRGLGATPNLQFVPATNPAAAQTACAQIGGTWQAASTEYDADGNELDYQAGCTFDIGSDGPPSWCGWPFMPTLFPETCSPATAAQLAAYGNYTAYQTAQLAPGPYTPPGSSAPAPVGTDASAVLVAQNAAQSAALVAAQPCEYLASANYPGFASLFGPTLTAMLTNPMGTGCQASFPGWMLYGVLGVALWAYLSGGRR